MSWIIAWVLSFFLDPNVEAARAAAAVHVAAASLRVEQPRKPEPKPAGDKPAAGTTQLQAAGGIPAK